MFSLHFGGGKVAEGTPGFSLHLGGGKVAEGTPGFSLHLGGAKVAEGTPGFSLHLGGKVTEGTPGLHSSCCCCFLIVSLISIGGRLYFIFVFVFTRYFLFSVEMDFFFFVCDDVAKWIMLFWNQYHWCYHSNYPYGIKLVKLNHVFYT